LGHQEGPNNNNNNNNILHELQVGLPVAKLVLNRHPSTTMAEHQPAHWKIFCVVAKQNRPFSVDIQPDATVDDLKKAIKTAKQATFDHFDADSLDLFKVDVPALDLIKDSKLIDGLDLTSMIMDPVFELRDYYSEPPPKYTIHVLVQDPSARK
jgi:Crinkler effector protein N-terminal domain